MSEASTPAELVLRTFLKTQVPSLSNMVREASKKKDPWSIVPVSILTIHPDTQSEANSLLSTIPFDQDVDGNSLWFVRATVALTNTEDGWQVRFIAPLAHKPLLLGPDYPDDIASAPLQLREQKVMSAEEKELAARVTQSLFRTKPVVAEPKSAEDLEMERLAEKLKSEVPVRRPSGPAPLNNEEARIAQRLFSMNGGQADAPVANDPENELRAMEERMARNLFRPSADSEGQQKRAFEVEIKRNLLRGKPNILRTA
jgi:hypothetical protein